MAVGTGYSKVASNGLVFAYDMGDTRNSWIGQPGTNITTGVGRSYNGYSMTTYSPGVFFETNGFTETVNIPALGSTVAQSIFINNSSPGINCCPNLFSYTGGFNSPIWSGNTTYTYQIIYKSLSGYTHPNFMYRYEYNSSGGYLTEVGVFNSGLQESLGDGWFHAWNTFTTQPTAALGYTGLWYYQYNTPDIISIAAISIVPGNTIRPARQLIPSGTTRSNTQGLLDLSRTGTLTLNTSYNSNAQIIFDGTDDRISIPSNPSNNVSGNITMEVILNRNAGAGGVVIHKEVQYTLNVLGDGRITYADSSFWSYASFGYHGNVPAGQNNHLVATKSGSLVTIYLNGNVVVSQNFGGSISQTNNTLFVGSYNGSSDFFSGQLPVAKVYNRALTVTEISDNYNHYRTRFNMP